MGSLAIEVIERRTIKGESLTEIAKSFNVSHTTIMRVMERNAPRYAQEDRTPAPTLQVRCARRASMEPVSWND
jgi:IS30 family transposase